MSDKNLLLPQVANVAHPSCLEDMEKQLDNQIVSILRDTFSLSEPYDRCRLCGELITDDDATLRCASCPCVYHVRCAGKQNNESDSLWHCSSCQSKGIEHAEEVLGLDNKSQYCVQGALLFLYVHTDRCWKKAFIIGVHSAEPSLVLVKWLDRGQSYKWVDINAVRILKAARSSSGASEGQRKRRRESTTTERNVVNGKRQRTKFSSSALHAMDGDSDEDSDGRTPRRRSSNGRRTPGKTNVDENGIKMSNAGDGMTDTYIGSQSLQAALCTAGSACRAVDLVMERPGSNVFVCTRPPGHHAGRYGCTRGCLSTGFCLLNNAAIALTYARVRYGVQRVAVVDIDVHFGNGTAEILRSDPNAFFASVHMVYGAQNDGHFDDNKDVEAFGFYPAFMGRTEVTANYVSVGIQPSSFSDIIQRHSRLHKVRAEEDEVEEESEVEVEAEAEVEGEDDDGSIMSLEDGAEAAPAATATGEEKAKEEHTTSESKPSSAESAAGGVTFIGSEGYLAALRDVIIPQMEEFKPELLIISAGFDGYLSDPLGNELKLSLDDYTQSTLMVRLLLLCFGFVC